MNGQQYKCSIHLTTHENGRCLYCQPRIEKELYGDEPFTAWLIEKESPAKYFKASEKLDGTYIDPDLCDECKNKKALYESYRMSFWWTYDAHNAIHFISYEDAAREMKRLTSIGIKGDLRVCEHMFNCGTTKE